MNIIIAKASGFCFGVKKAVEAVNKNITKNNLKTFGPIIHNQQVVKEFSEKGVQIANTVEDTKECNIIIRSHGISPKLQSEIEKTSKEVIDATCPFVKRIHKITKKYFDLGYNIILFGNQNHPEMIGVNGWCEDTAIFVKTLEDAENLPEMQDVCLASQTTMPKKTFDQIKEVIIGKTKGKLEIFDTICSATEERQEAAKELAQKVDKVIVIGGYNSSNTQKLVDICKNYCDKVLHIETADEIPHDYFNINDTVGITAGASTPDWIVEEVIDKLKEIDHKRS